MRCRSQNACMSFLSGVVALILNWTTWPSCPTTLRFSSSADLSEDMAGGAFGIGTGERKTRLTWSGPWTEQALPGNSVDLQGFVVGIRVRSSGWHQISGATSLNFRPLYNVPQNWGFFTFTWSFSFFLPPPSSLPFLLVFLQRLRRRISAQLILKIESYASQNPGIKLQL